jgi:hypothetical protein
VRYLVMRLSVGGHWTPLSTWLVRNHACSDLARQHRANPNCTVGLWDHEERKWIA